MAELSEKERKFLAQTLRLQRPLGVLGAVVSLLAASYMVWAVVRYDPRADPRANPGFDWPIARVAFLFDRHQFVVENAQADTPTEQRLMRRLSRNMQFSAGVMVLLLRLVFGVLTLVTGFAIMTVVVERARLLRIISRLEE